MKADFKFLKLEIYGESHAPEIGVKIGGIPVGCELSLNRVENFLSRRRSVNGVWSTPRREEDAPIILSGLEKTETGYVVDGEINICIKNSNVRPSDYLDTAVVPRPSHADYAAFVRDGKISSGGGRFSGRMTAPLCIAGGIAQELLDSIGIRVCAYISSIGGVDGASYKTEESIALHGIDVETENRLKASAFALLDESVRPQMEERIRAAAADGDSVGGTVDCVVQGIDAGMLGDAMFDGLEGKIAYSVYAIPAVKGVEFGAGFDISKMRGSEANDEFVIRDGDVATATNNSGGINGGISNGMPLTLRAAFRPTPSIAAKQRSVDLEKCEECELNVKGRHDSCIVPRAVPCVESAVSLAILDEILALRDGIQLYE